MTSKHCQSEEIVDITNDKASCLAEKKKQN